MITIGLGVGWQRYIMKGECKIQGDSKLLRNSKKFVQFQELTFFFPTKKLT